MNLILISSVLVLVTGLEPIKENDDENLKQIFAKYIDKIPDPEPKYVINEALTKMITQYFNGKISTFPLYKISMKIDKTPVKIPWTLGQQNLVEAGEKRHLYMKVEVTSTTPKPNE